MNSNQHKFGIFGMAALCIIFFIGLSACQNVQPIYEGPIVPQIIVTNAPGKESSEKPSSENSSDEGKVKPLTPELLQQSDHIHIVQVGEGLYSIARHYGVNYKYLADINNIPSPYAITPGQALRIGSNNSITSSNIQNTNPSYYLFQRGDTLYSVARRFGVSVQELAAWNGITPPYGMYVGQKVIVVSPDSSSSEQASSLEISPQKSEPLPEQTPVYRHEHYYALIIGNTQYEYSPLRTPHNDANDMAAALKKLGFEVDLRQDLDFQALDMAAHEFTEKLKQESAIGLLYYAGHGAQAGGRNYLIPINNQHIRSETELPYKALAVSQIQEQMQASGAQVSILILDACRDNPYQGATRTLSRGLGRLQPLSGSLVGYAAAEGGTASDISDNNRNGLYTRHLLEVLRTADERHIRMDDLFMEVRKRVINASNGQQRPSYLSSLNEPFCFGGCP